jgi:hypothetical protein
MPSEHQPEAAAEGPPMILYRVLADLVVLLHAAFVAFVVVGEIAVLYGLARGRGWARAFWFRWLHLASIAFVVLLSWLGATCPLTDLENSLRERGGEVGYPGDFISYWVRELLFYECSTSTFIVVYSAFGMVVLATFLLAGPQRRTADRDLARKIGM